MPAYHINGPNFYGFDPDDGSPLAGGKLYTYEPGTTTPRATYTTEVGDVANANPVILNAAGYAAVYLIGVYRLVLYDADDVLVWDESPVTQANLPDATDIGNYALDTGAADAYVIDLPSWTVYTDGAGLWFKADNDSTGPSTMNVSALGVTDIKKDYDLDIEAGDIKEGGIYQLRYDGVNFQLVEGTTRITSAELNRLDGISLTDPIITLAQTTKALWYQDVAPTGWTIVAAVDDHAVSLTKGSVASGIEGGTVTGTNAFSDQFAAHAEGAALGVGNKTLQETHIPSHNHGGGNHDHSADINGSGGALQWTANATQLSNPGGTSEIIEDSGTIISLYGGGTGHSHTIDQDVDRAHCIIAAKD